MELVNIEVTDSTVGGLDTEIAKVENGEYPIAVEAMVEAIQYIIEDMASHLRRGDNYAEAMARPVQMFKCLATLTPQGQVDFTLTARFQVGDDVHVKEVEPLEDAADSVPES